MCGDACFAQIKGGFSGSFDNIGMNEAACFFRMMRGAQTAQVFYCVRPYGRKGYNVIVFEDRIATENAAETARASYLSLDPTGY